MLRSGESLATFCGEPVVFADGLDAGASGGEGTKEDAVAIQ